jgi:hypothetical protein
MVHLMIKQYDISKISIIEKYNTYRLTYNFSYTNIIGLPIFLNNIDIQDKQHIYKLIIKDKSTLNILQDIDSLFTKNISNYISFLKNVNSEWYIVFKKNSTVIHKMDGKLNANLGKQHANLGKLNANLGKQHANLGKQNDNLGGKQNDTSVLINILFIKKGASYNYPIVYLL